MDAVPWTVAAFKQRRRATWKAIRLWLVLQVVASAGFCVPFYTEKTNVKVDDVGSRATYHLSLDDMTGSELIISLVSFVVAGMGLVGIIMGVQRHYRCPKCEEVLQGTWYGQQAGLQLFPTTCSNCGARLSE